jgi:hypothetical protein
VVVTGYFGGTVNFGGTNLTSAGLYDIFVAKFSAAGGHVWSMRFGSSNYDYGYGVAVDSGGNVLLTGSFYSATDFGGGFSLVSPWGNDDVFIAKFCPDGSITGTCPDGTRPWAKNFSNTSKDVGNGIAADLFDDSIVITGYFSGTINFTDGGTYASPGALSAAGTTDIFLAKFHNDGTYWWSKRFGGTMASDQGRGVAVDSLSDVVVTGNFQYTANFGGATLSSSASTTSDVFLASYDAQGNHRWSTQAGGVADDIGVSVAVVAGRNDVVLTGYTLGPMGFGGACGTLSTAGGADGFVAKYSAAGACVWANLLGGTDYDYSLGAAADASGNAVVTGSSRSPSLMYSGSAVFANNAGGYDAYLLAVGP